MLPCLNSFDEIAWQDMFTSLILIRRVKFLMTALLQKQESVYPM